MVFPDWPTSNDKFINPDGWWAQDAMRWEHGHRLIGWVVGMLAIVLVALSWKSGGRLRLLGLLTLVAICVQGLLGGLRVSEISTTLAMVHGVWGQICFCLACSTALLASRSWVERQTPQRVHAGVLLQRLCLFGVATILIQLILGAALRHFPQGSFLVAHVLWAIVAVFLAGWLAMWVGGSDFRPRILVHLGRALGGLMATQLVLGGFAWVVTFGPSGSSAFLTWAVPTAHVAVGSLALVSAVLLTISVHGLLEPATRGQVSNFSPVNA
jgi:cytochrome c oxidase assembly protein subunit 15